ncbi:MULTISPECIES: hypothetical protein [unclassified Streptomyces]|uniref:hypothetical protein n=1 Tax=unclassified Streptomyces TaxID=2593676 RepID=UPI00093889B7|nr:hypothetical protein [Streptomyces sp. TSRI0107]
MVDVDAGELQIYSVEERETAAATCIVRCVGGIPRTGQRFLVGSALDPAARPVHVTLDWICRYGKRVDFVDPPHSAIVRLSGEAVAVLERGVILTSVAVDAPCDQ